MQGVTVAFRASLLAAAVALITFNHAMRLDTPKSTARFTPVAAIPYTLIAWSPVPTLASAYVAFDAPALLVVKIFGAIALDSPSLRCSDYRAASIAVRACRLNTLSSQASFAYGSAMAITGGAVPESLSLAVLAGVNSFVRANLAVFSAPALAHSTGHVEKSGGGGQNKRMLEPLPRSRAGCNTRLLRQPLLTGIPIGKPVLGSVFIR